jgi:hypothetical protein
MTQAFNLSQFANKVNTSGQASLTTAVTGTLPVANGGTNQTTYTDGQLLIGNTTGNTLTKATLTAGTGISVTNGAGAITIASTAAGGFSQMQVFTSPGTFTTPASTTQIKVTVIGAGGNAFGAAPVPQAPARSGGGGGGGAIYVGPITASTPYAVTIGSAPGGTSSFGVIVSATGGANGTPGVGGAGGAGSGGTINFGGDRGGINAVGAPGGTSALGFGFGAVLVPTSTAVGYGGGGGVGAPSPGVSLAGAPGVVIVEY